MDAEYLKKLHDERRHAFETQEQIVARGPMDAEAEAEFDRAQVAYEQKTAEIDRLMAFAAKQKDRHVVDEAFASVVRPQTGHEGPAASAFEKFLRGDVSAANVRDDSGKLGYEIDLSGAAKVAKMVRAGADAKDIRAAIQPDGGSSGGSLVLDAQTLASIYTYLEAPGAIRGLADVWQSSNGAQWTVPKTSTIAVGTRIATTDTAFGGTDPVLATMTLNGYTIGDLILVPHDMVTDSAFDIVSYVTEQGAYAVGRVAATAYATGSGSSWVNGVITATTGSVTTGGTIIPPEPEDFVDLQHKVTQMYRDRGSYVMLDSTLGTVRKYRADAGGTTGPWLLEPPSAPGQPLGIFGRPVYTDFNVAAIGSGAAICLFGDVSAYKIRDVGGLRFDVSTEYAFNKDQVAYRTVLRTDGDLIDTNATAMLKMIV